MAEGINFGLLGVGEPSAFQQAQSRDMQAQLQQQQLVNAQTQTKSSQMQLQQMIDASARTKRFNQIMAEKGGDPGNWQSFADALHATNDPENVKHSMEMYRDHYNTDRLNSFVRGEEPPKYETWLSRIKGVKPSAAVAPVNANAPVINIADIAAGKDMPAVNALAPNTESVNALNTINGVPVTQPDVGTKPLSEAQIIQGMALTPGGGNLAKVRADLYKPSDIGKLEAELAELRVQKVPETDNAIKSRLAMIDSMVYGKASNYPEFLIAKDQGFKGNYQNYLEWDAKRKRSEQPSVAAPVTLATIVDPDDPTKTKVVDARTGRAIGEGTKTSPGADLTAKDRQTREAKYPQATMAVKTFESKADKLAKDLETLANHPGLSGISGILNGRTMAFSGPARQALALYDSIVARGGFKELADMRASSPTGGALGNVSNQEGQYLRDAFAALNRTQDTPDLAKSLNAAAQDVKAGKERVREAYDATYEYRAGQSDRPSGGGKKPAAALPPGFVPDK